MNVGGNGKKQNKFNSKSSYAAILVSENEELVLMNYGENWINVDFIGTLIVEQLTIISTMSLFLNTV